MKGLSPLVGLALTIGISTAAVAITVALILPTMDRMKDSSIISEGLENLELINSAIREVASESEGSRRTITFTVTDGEYIIDNNKELIYFEYTPKSDLLLEGTMGNVYLERNPVFLEYFNYYQADSDASPTWKVINGTCKVEYGMYYCNKGAAYANVTNITQDFTIYGKIINRNGKGEIFPLSVAPENLVLYLTFDEGSGNTTYDYSLHYNNGTLKDANASNSDGDTPPQWVDGKFGKGLSFDGVDDYVRILAINLSRYSVSLWFYYSVLPTAGEVLFHRGYTWEAKYEPQISIGSDGRVYAKVSGTSNAGLIGSGIANPGKWHHVVCVVDGSQSQKLYVDGTEVASTSKSITIAPLYIVIGAAAKDNDGYADFSYFNGTIDEVRIYDKALNETEIKAEYELGLKRLQSTGKTTTVEHKNKIYLVVSNPSGKSYFDDIKVNTVEKKMKLVLPLENVDITNSGRIGKGNIRLVIENEGLNEGLNRPIIRITVS